jgi:hypothetical protein
MVKAAPEDHREDHRDDHMESVAECSEPTTASTRNAAPSPAPGGGTRRSRRALLRQGGAAAAGVAAVAAGVTELARPGTAHAHFETITDHWTATGTGNIAIEGDGTSNAVGVQGTSDTSVGVVAVSNSNVTSALYAYGTGTTGKGAWGYAPTGIGVEGQSNTDTGVLGSGGSGYGGHFVGGSAPLWLHASGSAGAPASGAHHSGELYVDSGGVLWYCVASGTPGTWIRLSGPQSGTQGGTISYLSSPVRLLDARTLPGAAVITRGPLGGNEIYPFTVAGLGGSGIPGSAQGLIGNITVLGPSDVGNLSLFPAGGAVPTVASMTFGTAGLFLANGVNVAIGTGGAINIQNQSGGTTPLVLDAVAYVS